MGIYRRKDSNSEIWWISYTYKGQQHKKSTGTDDKKLAERYYDSIKGKLALGILMPEAVENKKQRYTFSELTEKYSAWAEGRQKSWERSRSYLSQQLVKRFGPLYLDEINVNQLEQYQTDATKAGSGVTGINRKISLLKAMFTKALDWQMITETVLLTVRRVKPLKGEKKRLRYLSAEECQSLLNSCEPHLKPIVQFAFNTGCRRGEILKLIWENVDLKHGFISIPGNITKNGDRREIPINDSLRVTLQGITRRLDVPHVFHDAVTGKPYGDVKRSFNTALRRAGIKDFHFHDLRHTFASHLVMAGVDITTVSRLLGHKSLTMTLRYSHLAPEHLAAGIKKLDEIFNPKNASFEAKKEADYTNFRTATIDKKISNV